MNAIRSGRLLEKVVYTQLKTIKNINIIPQYKYVDIFDANARMDFCVEKKFSSRFLIECKNQNVPGSLDQKFPYYIENMRENKYGDDTLIFVLNTNGIRQKVLEYLVNNTNRFNYKIVDVDNIKRLNNIINDEVSDSVFLKK